MWTIVSILLAYYMGRLDGRYEERMVWLRAYGNSLRSLTDDRRS